MEHEPVIDGTWNLARHQDLISEEGVGLSAGPLERGPVEHACTSAFPQTERCIPMVKHGHHVRNSIVDDIKQLHKFLHIQLTRNLNLRFGSLFEDTCRICRNLEAIRGDVLVLTAAVTYSERSAHEPDRRGKTGAP